MLELVGNGWRREIGVGGHLTFGRGGDGVDVALADDPRLHRCCGSVSVTGEGWDLRNAGRWLRIRLVSMDRFGLDSLLPGQQVRVPWSRTRVELHVGTTVYAFEATYGSPVPVGAGPTAGPAGRTPDGTADDGDDETTTAPVRVDRDAGYFRVLVALCEPQLVDPSSIEVATDLQIARRLNRSLLEVRPLSGKTVERRLDTCRAHFGLKDADEYGQSVGLERRDSRRVLVERALLTGTVTPNDLAILEPAATVRATDRTDA